MKEIVIISGKGGTGKTSVTAAIGYILGEKAVLADCDVDAANLHLLMQPVVRERERFVSGQLAQIDNSACTSCDLCREKCRFGAINSDGSIYSVSGIDDIRIQGRDSSGRVKDFLIRYRGGQLNLPANDFRMLMGPFKFRSVLIDRFEWTGEQMIVRGRGWGHGVGLCQYGAKKLVLAG